jgi:hypothetical protein
LLVASGSKCDKLKEIFDFRNHVKALFKSWKRFLTLEIMWRPCLKVGASIHLGFPQLEWVQIEMRVYWSAHEQWEGKGRKFKRECVGGCVRYFVGIPEKSISSTFTSFNTRYPSRLLASRAFVQREGNGSEKAKLTWTDCDLFTPHAFP